MSEQRSTSQELGDFLRTRRAALSPAESGVPTYGSPRRVPGLRREEVAQLAGVSVNYYTRIKQGESHQMSDSVMESIANALQLDVDERSHFLRLARPAQVVRRTTGPERVRDSVLALAESTSDQEAIIVGRRIDLLGGNRIGFALLGLRGRACACPTTQVSGSSSAVPRRGRAHPSASAARLPHLVVLRCRSETQKTPVRGLRLQRPFVDVRQEPAGCQRRRP
jgi:transcriptional regulator with XRE-family HTH domain